MRAGRDLLGCAAARTRHHAGGEILARRGCSCMSDVGDLELAAPFIYDCSSTSEGFKKKYRIVTHKRGSRHNHHAPSNKSD